MARDSLAQLDLRLAKETLFIPKQETEGTIVILPERYKDVDIFALLLWRFKRPNGLLTMFGPPHGDAAAPFKWAFSFVAEDGLMVAVIRTWRNIEIWLRGREVSRDDVLAFVDFNLRLHKEEIAAERSRLEQHRLIINPYVRHRRMVTFASSELLRTKVPSIWYPPGNVVGQGQMKRHMDTLQKHMRGAQRETFFSVTLASEAAFMAEAFLNLLLAISLPDVIRNNRTFFEEALRRPWKSKLQHRNRSAKDVWRS